MKTFLKKSLAVFLAVLMVAGVCPLWLISFTVSAAEPTQTERSWTLPVATFDSRNRFDTITVDSNVYYYGSYIESSATLKNNIGSSGLEWVYYAYGDDEVTAGWTYGMIIRPKAGVASAAIPDNWTDYQSTFKGTLKEVYITDGVTGIGDNVFKNQVNLKNVYLASSVKSIGNSTFAGCGELYSINLQYVETIGSYAFYDGSNICSKLKGSLIDTDGNLYGGIGIATAPGTTLRSIGAHAFRGCSALKYIYIGSGESNDNRAVINSYAFYNTSGEKHFELGSNINMNGSHHFSYSYNIRSVKAGDNVKFGTLSFYDCYNIQTLTVGDNIDIGERCFDLCTSLTTSEGETYYIDLTGVNTIGSYAFRSNTKLKGAKFSARLTSIGTLAFSDCEKFTYVNLCDTSLTELSRGVFARTGLTSVIIPKNIITIGDFAFSAYIPEENARVSDWYVSGWNVSGDPSRKLTSVSFETGSVCTTVGAYAFYRQKLSAIEFPSTVNNIGGWAFYCAGTISEVVLPNTASTQVGNGAFAGIGLTSIKVLAQNSFSCGTYAFQSNYINTLEIAATGSVSLGSQSFYNNRYLTKLEINAATTTIGNSAFSCDDKYAQRVDSTDVYSDLSYPAFQTLTEVSITGSKVSIGDYAFRNQMNLANLNMLGVTEKSKLSVGHYAFGHDAYDAYCTVNDPLNLTKPDGTGISINIQHGMTVLLGNMDEDGPKSLFVDAKTYYKGNDYTTTLISTKYPTCTEAGEYLYRLHIQESGSGSGSGSDIDFIIERPAIGHLYSDEVFNYANCVYGEYAEKHCIRGSVTHEYGVNADGYAKANSSGTLLVTSSCVETGATVITEIENSECLNHEYYAGTLYYKENVEITAAEYNKLGEDLKSNFFIWYKNKSTDEFINAFAYGKLTQEEKDNYKETYRGTMYLTVSEYNKLADKSGYKSKEVGKIIYGDPDVNNGAITINNVGGTGSTETFTSPFTNYIPVYIEYACYRDTHSVLSDTESYPYRVAYLPTNLKGNTDQKLADIALELKNLGWADSTTSLAGTEGVRQYIGIYKNDGNGVDVFKNVELNININISRVELSIESLSLANLKQSTAVARKHVEAVNLPAGVTAVASSADTYFENDGTTSIAWETVATNKTGIEGIVKYKVTYKNSIYNLIADVSGSSSVYWKDGVYNITGIDSADSFKKIAEGYTLESIEINGDNAELTLSHSFLLQPPSLSIVDAKADSVTYDEGAHGFVLTDIPASSAITVTRWTKADSSGIAVSGTGAYSDTQTLSVPSGSLDVYSDLREVDSYSGIATDAGTYYYKVEVTNDSYSGNNGGTSYTFYVTVNIDRAALTVPTGAYYEYDATDKTGFTADPRYDIDGDNSAKNAGTYKVTLTLTNNNYYWKGYAESTRVANVTWKIQKMTVKVPEVDETKRELDYNGTWQTPLNLTTVNTVDSSGVEKAGDYRTSQDSQDLTKINVELYDGTDWHTLYQLTNGYGLDVGSSKVITASTYSGFSGLFDTQNLMWPNQSALQSSATVNLGTWTIKKAVLENPTITLPNKEYDGNEYNEAPVLSGTWTWVNSNGNVFDQDTTGIVFEYYNGNTKLDQKPTEAGLYTVKANIKSKLNDKNYTLANVVSSSIAYATGTFQITKANITLVSTAPEVNSSATKPYTGKQQYLPELNYYNGDQQVSISESDIVLRYYKAVEETVTPADSSAAYKVYRISTDDAGSLTAPNFTDIGTYVYMVTIDDQCENYQAVNYATLCLVIEKSQQGISVLKADQNAQPKVIPSGADYIIEANLGDAPLELNVTGEFDKKSVIDIPVENINVTNSPVTAKTEKQTEGTGLTLAFGQMTDGTVISVHTDGTDNAYGTDCTITVKINKARPTVTVSSALVGTTNKYTGNAVYTFTTSVSGTNVLSINNVPTALPITTEGANNNCDLLFYTTEASAKAHDGNCVTDQPVEEGQYWVVAKYKGDANYLEYYSDPLNFSVGAATLSINGVSDVEKNYDATPAVLLEGIVVTGNGENLTSSAVSSAALGSYWIEYYPSALAKQPEATNAEWSITPPSIINVGSSGTYWYRVKSKNYETETKSFTVTINKVNVILSADASIALERQYDGTNKLYSKTGADNWIASAAAENSACQDVVNHEINGVTATATLPGGKNATKNGNVTIVYTVDGDGRFDKSNYTFNGKDLTDALTLTDASTYKATITKKELTVTGIAGIARQYDGTKLVKLDSSSIAVTGFVGSESITFALYDYVRGELSSAISGEEAIVKYVNGSQIYSDYTVMFAAEEGTDTDLQNYTIKTVNFPTVTISDRDVDIDVADIPAEYTYTGEAITGYDKATIKTRANTYNTDAASVASDLTGEKSKLVYKFYTTNNAGVLSGLLGTDAAPVAPTSSGTYYLQVSYAGSDEYAQTVSEPVTITVNKAEAPTVEFQNNKWTYDGTAHDLADMVKNVTGTTHDNALTGYTVKFYSDSARTKEVTDVKNVSSSGTYYYTVSAENYKDAESTVTVTISKKNVTITKPDVTTLKVYDGKLIATVKGETVVSGAVEGETITATAAAEYNSAEVSAATTITVTYTMTFAGGANPDNYTYTAGTTSEAAFTKGTKVTAEESFSGSITKLALALKGITAITRTYDGTNKVDLVTSTATLNGVISEDSSAVKLAYIPTTGIVNDVNYSADAKEVIVIWSSATLTGEKAGNYTVTSGATVTVHINKAEADFEWVGTLKAGWSGAPVEPGYYEIKVTGKETSAEVLAYNDTNSTAISYFFYSDSTCTSSAVAGHPETAPTERGTYYVKAVYAGSENYNSKEEVKQLLVTATGIFGSGSDITANNRTYDGISSAIISNIKVLSDLVDSVSGNHKEITSSSNVKIYLAPVKAGEDRPENSSAVWQLAYGYAANKLITDGIMQLKDAGTYTYWVKITADSHEDCEEYSGHNGKITVTIEKASITVDSVVTKTKVYDGKVAATVVSSAITGIQNSENITLDVNAVYANKAAGSDKTVKVTYTLTFGTGADANNYSVVAADSSVLTAKGNAYTASYSDGTIQKKNIVINGINATDRIYDNTVIVALTGTPVSSDGLCVNDNSETDDVTLTLRNNQYGTISSAKPGKYSADVDTDAIKMEGADKDNYEIVSVKSPEVTIAKKQIEITFGTKTTSGGIADIGSLANKTFTNKAMVIPANESAVKSGDVTTGTNPASSENITYTYWTNSSCTVAAVGDGSTAPTSSGTYYVKAEVAENDYYLGAKLVAKVVIDEAGLNVTATAYNAVYDGKSHTPATFTVKGADGKDITAYTVKFYSDAERTKEIETVKNYSDSKTYYYTISYNDYKDYKGTVTVNVTRISVILSSSITTNRVYNATASAAVADPTITVSGNATRTALVNSEFAVSASAAYNDKNAGTGKTITVTYTITAKSSALLENYLFNNNTLKTVEDVVEVTDGVITKAAVGVSGASANNKTYDGKATASFKTYGVLSGAIAGDDVKLVTSSASAKFANANAADGKTVSYSGYTLSGADKDNYTLSQPASTTADIAKKNIASSAVVLGTALTYNGKTQTQTIKSVKIDGLTVTYTATGSSAVNAGEHTMTLSGTGNFTGTREVKWSIAKAQYDMSGITFVSTSGIYNGKDQSIVIGGTLPTGSDGYQVVVHYDGAQKNVGSHAVVATFTTSSSNYYAPAAMNAVITVTKKAVTIKPNALSKVYGDADPTTGYTITAGSMVGSEALSDIDISRVACENVGTYTYSIDKTKANNANTNYDVSVETALLTVSARPVVIEIKDQTHEYNNAEPWTNRKQTSSAAIYWTVKSGAIQNNARVSDDKDSLNVVLTKAAGVNVGSTAITGTWNNKNYAVTFEDGIYTVTPRDITVVIGDAEEIYGDNPDMNDVTLTAMKGAGSDAIAQNEIAKIREDLAQSGTFAIKASSQSTVGTYSIVASSGIYGNYNVTIQDGTYTVSKRAITIKADALQKYYDADPAALTYTVTSGELRNGDKLTVVLSSAIAKNTDVGSTAILVESVTMSSGIDKTSNYDITCIDSVYTVVPAGFSVAFVKGEGTKATTFGETFQNPIILTNNITGREMTASSGNAFDGTITWTVSSTAIATVDSNGIVTPVTTGIVTVYVTFADSHNYTIGTATIKYDLAIAAAGSIVASATPYVGTQKLTSAKKEGEFELIDLVNVTVTTPASGYVLKIEYSTDNGQTWSENVPSSAVAGTTEIKIKISDPMGEYGDFVCTVEAVIDARTKHNITFSPNSGTLTGSTAISRTDGVLLTADDFPTVTRKGYTFLGWTDLTTDETKTADEWAGMEITSTMMFSAAWEIETVTVTVTPSSAAYTGKEIEPEIVVKVGNITLSSGIDYNLIFGQNINAGTARYSIVGIGNFANIRKSGTFTITKIKQEVLMETTIRGSLSVNDRISNIALGLKESPVVTYESSSSAILTISNNGLICAVSSGSVEITVTVGDTDNYIGYTYKYNVTVVDTEPEENSGTVTNDEGLEPGTYISIEISSSSSLDETIRSSANFFASDATLIYSGMSADELKEIALEGGFRYTLEISLKDNHDQIVTNYKGIYTVKVLLPDYLRKATNLQVVHVTDDGKVEVLETSRYGNYLVFTTTHFSAFSVYSYRNINDPQVSVEIASGSVYDGSHQVPTVVVRDIVGSGSVVLTEGVDYKLVYSENIYVGTAHVTVIGIGYYALHRTEDFTIAKAQNEWITSSSMSGWTYGSSAVVPVIGQPKFGTPVVKYYSDPACTENETIVRPTAVGDWYMKVTVADTANYTGLEEIIHYRVSAAVNEWITSSSMTGWVYGSSAVVPVIGVPKFGTPVVRYYSSYTDATHNKGMTTARPTAVGTWYMVVTVAATADYNGLEQVIPYTVSGGNNTWIITPSITGWTYGSSAVDPVIGVALYGTPVVRYYKSYTDETHNDGMTTARPTTVGTWYMVVTVAATADYDGLLAIIEYKVSAAHNYWVSSSSMSGWVYGSSAVDPVIGQPKFGTPVVKYYTDSSCILGETIVRPTAIGTWYMKVTVAGTENYNGLEEIISYTVSADTNTWITRPSMSGWTYGSSAVDPVIGVSKYGTPVVRYYSSYTDATHNEGMTTARPTSVGTWYMVVTVEGTADYNGLFEKIEYTVSAAQNYWVSSSSMSGWAYGSSAVDPVIGQPKFGTPVVKYYSDSACTENETIVRPTAIGTWYMKVTVAGCAEYNALEQIIEYTVSGGVNTWTVEPSISNWTYGETPSTPVIGVAKYGTPVVKYYSNEECTQGETNVRPTTVGTWYMKVTVAGNADYNGLTKVVAYKVSADTNVWITEPSISSWVYGDNPSTPVIGVAKYGTPVVKYYSNSACTQGETNVRPTGIGTWYMKVTVEGCDGYETISVVKAYEVSRGTNIWYIEPSIDGWTYGSAASTAYEGVSKFGTPVIRYYTNSACTEGESDTVITNIGTWYMKVTVAGTTEYSSLSAVKAYTVSQYSNNRITALSIPGWTYGAKPVAPAAYATYGTIVYTYAVKGTNNFTDEVPTDCGQYTVKAEVYEKAEYNGCTAYADFTISPRQLDATNVYGLSARTYTGFPISPTVYVYWGDTILTRGVDYDVKVTNNVNIGSANVVITYKGNYTGSANLSFAILKKTGICVDTNATGFIWNGLGQHPNVTVTDEENDDVLVEGVDFTVSYRNSKGESVSSPVAAGVYTMYVNGCGNYTGSLASVVFVISKIHTGIEFAEDVITEIYSSGMQIPGNMLETSFAGPRTFTSSNESVVKVDSDGKLTIVGAGSAIITVYVEGDDNHEDATASYRVNISRKSIEGLTATGISDMIYTGKQITLEAGLRDGDKILTEGIDYAVTYINNVETGTATVVYTGFGDYTGSITKTFEITSKTLDSSAIEVIPTLDYTGKALEPTVIVKDGDKVLTKDVDYTVKYIDNVNVGTATAMIEFIGNYTGAGETHFEIAEKTNDITIGLSFGETVYNTQKQIPEISVKDGETVLAEGKDYTVIIRDINGNVVENPVNAGAYTVEIIGKGNYNGVLTRSAYVIKTLTTEAAFTSGNVTKSFGDDSFTNALTVTPSAEHGTVVYTSSNSAVATVDADGKVTITGFGSAQITATVADTANTTGAVATYSVNVNPKTTSGLKVTLSGNTIYTGKAVTPSVVIKDGNKVLVEGEDYTLTYVNNVNAGTATVKINYINNYSGKSEVRYTVTAYENRVSVSFDKASFVYNGNAQIPEITVKDGSVKLIAGKDYTVGTFGVDGKAVSPIAAGTYTVIINGAGNYHGTIASAVYEIKAAPVTAKFAQETISKTYGDAEFENKLTITPATTAIPQYTSSNTAVATVDAFGKITVVGAGSTKISVYIPATHDYEATSAEYTLTVSAKAITGSGFTVDKIEKQIYTGKALTPAVNVYDGKTKLIADRDYTVTYTDNTAIGTAKVEVNGIGAYAGKVNTEFVIVANVNTFEIGEIETFVYNGKETAPKPEVKYAGVVLTEGVDYELSYVNNTATGVATVTVTGLGAYEGLTEIANYTIKAANVSSVDPLNGVTGILAVVSNSKGFGADYRIAAEHVEKTESSLKKITGEFELFASDADEDFSKLTEEELRALVKNRKVLLTLDIKLMCGDYVVTEFDGVYTVKIMIPEELYGAENIQVAYKTADGKIELFETRIEDGYIVFETTHFSDFMFLGKTSWWSWWWIVVLCCFICATTIVICIVITKKKDEDDEEGGKNKGKAAKQNA